ncbi:hypothetical protein BGX34_009197 [Mortierella sp. NVP85]|nr:hypothetical protein BGX34_009197 [Mortierella sp. NVP85]
MTGNLGRLAQAWPRAVLSLMSFTWALLTAAVFWQRAVKNGGPSEVYEDVEPLQQAALTLSFMTIALSTLLTAYAVIRKSLTATKLLYAGWWFGMAAFLLTWLVCVPLGLYYAPLETKELLSIYPVSAVVMDALIKTVNGWALVVYMRDLRGQRRSAWGCLVKDEGYIMLQTHDAKDTV